MKHKIEIAPNLAIYIDGENTVIDMKENSADVISVMFGDTILEEENDYTLCYFDKNGSEILKPENAGEYTVSAVGKNKYSGECRKDFEINNYIIIIIPAAVLTVIIIISVCIVVSKKRSQNNK